jgi:hypothetical protein
MVDKQLDKALIIRNQTVYTYSYLWFAANDALRRGLESQGGGFQFLSSIVLFAFTVEAFINNTALSLVADFEEFERKKTGEKFDFVCERLAVSFPGGVAARPLQTLVEVFKFRNAMAHGKTTTLRPDPKTVVVNQKLESILTARPMTNWEPRIHNSKFAERAREDVEKILNAIHMARPKPKEPLFMLGEGSGRAVPLDDDES